MILSVRFDCLPSSHHRRYAVQDRHGESQDLGPGWFLEDRFRVIVRALR